MFINFSPHFDGLFKMFPKKCMSFNFGAENMSNCYELYLLPTNPVVIHDFSVPMSYEAGISGCFLLHLWHGERINAGWLRWIAIASFGVSRALEHLPALQ